MTQVLSVVSECAPLVKTGGLADVAGALPIALEQEGVRMRTLMPLYPQVKSRAKGARKVLSFDDLMGGPARVLAAKVEGLDLLLLDAPHLYDREGSIYLGPDGRDWPDNPERFAALGRAAAVIAAEGVGGWRPDVLHGHDWQAGLMTEYLHQMGLSDKVGTVMTIHNMAFHGLAPVEKISTLGLDPERFTSDGYEFWGQIAALKAGLINADKLTTVSPTYAEELMTEHFGFGLDGVMRYRRDDLVGILNGIDDATWDPKTDVNIPPYKTPRGKKRAKAALQKEFGLPTSNGPLCVVVSRLTEQKGLDLLLEAMPTLTARGGQLALLGSGDAGLEQAYRELASHENVGVRIGYDETLSHRLIAGGDAILVPSRFEPCGLTQLYGLRYGTIPCVALTGGLADTVINASPAALAAKVATGVQFSPITTEALRNAITRLCDLYQDAATWEKMQKNAMAQPVGWGPSAAKYAALYKDVLALK